MVKIFLYKSKKGAKVQVTVEENPLFGTKGNLLLLCNQYKQLQFLETPIYASIEANKNWMLSMLKKHGELHCEYCGQTDLKVYELNCFKREDGATIDHFYPRQNFKNLQDDKRNFVVSCSACNGAKKSNIYKIDKIKYPYSDTIKNISEMVDSLALNTHLL